MGDEELTDRFRIVFMCTGNQARSVIAEHYTRKITEGLPVKIESCGTMNTAGAPALPEAVEAAAELGLDLGGHGSRCYTALDLSKADLVIGFDQNHVATAVVEGNAGADKTFKLVELERLLRDVTVVGTGDPVADARMAIAHASRARTSSTMFAPGEDVADPAGRKPSFFRETATTIQRTCEDIVHRLFPVAERPAATPGAPDEPTSARIWD